MEDKETRSSFERHLQTGIQLALVALAVWLASTVQTTSVEVARLAVQVQALTKTVEELKASTANRYTSNDAARDFAVRDKATDDLRQRVRRLEEVVK